MPVMQGTFGKYCRMHLRPWKSERHQTPKSDLSELSLRGLNFVTLHMSAFGTKRTLGVPFDHPLARSGCTIFDASMISPESSVTGDIVSETTTRLPRLMPPSHAVRRANLPARCLNSWHTAERGGSGPFTRKPI